MPGAQNVDLYPYMAFGGDSPTYDVTTTMEGEDDMAMDVAGSVHDQPCTIWYIAALSGQPNTSAGSHNWILNARYSTSDQHVIRSWKLQVVQETYTAPGGNIAHTFDDGRADGDERAPWSGPTASQVTMMVDLNWMRHHAIGGTGVVLNLKNDLDANTSSPEPGAGTDQGPTIDPAVDDVADVDVFWVGPLTPDSVLSVKVAGTYEPPNSPGIFNVVTVTLHSFVSDGA